MTLPDDDRAELADVLLQSLKTPAEEVDRLWAEEAERRVKEIDDGTVTLLDGHEVMAEARARFRR
ncbi:MAG: addiction module protein [Acidobacteriota bacterium]